MKRFYLSKIAILLALFSALSTISNGQAPAPSVFPYTGGQQTWVVPPGVTLIGIDAIGGAGGYPYWQCGNTVSYGNAGRVQCKMVVTPGTTLYIYVGGMGGSESCSNCAIQSGGFNGGRNGSSCAGGSGGATDIRLAAGTISGSPATVTPYTATNRLVVAGGGGGGADYLGFGGGGGGLTGGIGIVGTYGGVAGAGGTQVGPGIGGASGSSNIGTLGVGGAYYNYSGGGGGYWGGNSGTGTSGGAGGGSSYTDPVLCSDVIHTQGYSAATGNGKVTITILCQDPGAITGTMSVCPGQTTTLSASATGGSWSSSNTTVAKVDTATGIVSGLVAGTASITYNIPLPCGGVSASTVVTVNPLPAAISGSTVAYACLGQSSVLSDASVGGTWISNNPVLATIGSTSGVVTGVNLGVNTITYKFTGTGCYVTSSQTVSALPTKYVTSVQGTGQYCPGAPGVKIFLSQSDANTNYDIYNGVKIAGPYPGLGLASSFDLGLHTNVGTNTVLATNTITGCYNTMSGSAVISLAPLPVSKALYVTGGDSVGSFCHGQPGINVYLKTPESNVYYQLLLGASTVGDTMSSTTGADINFGAKTDSGKYFVIATNLSTGCTNTMANNARIIENPLPNTYTISGGSAYCSGTGGVTDSLNNSDLGINYELYLNGTGTGIVKAGVGGVLKFTGVTTSGTYTAVATNASTTCKSPMAGSVGLVVNPLPSVANISTGGRYCPGASGAAIILDHSDNGINYYLYNPAKIDSLPGNGDTLTFNPRLAGSYYIVGVNASTGCKNTMNGTDVIMTSPLPTPYLVTGGGHYCSGSTGKAVGLFGTDFGTNYQLYLNNSPVGTTVTGSASAATFGSKTDTGIYTVIATDPVTKCSNMMNGSVSVAVDALPVADTVDVTNNGSYCVGGSGVQVKLKSSGIVDTYRLYLNGHLLTDMNSVVAGTGGAISFGIRTDTGVYTVRAVNNLGCTSAMTGSALVAINPLPTAFAITGGGPYCVSGTAANIFLSFSEPGVNYDLRNTTTGSVVASLSGTGAMLDFGAQSAAGSYTVTANNASTGCSSNMTGSVNVSTTALPTQYAISGGGNYCSGTPGTHVYLTASNVGIDYQLYNGSLPVGGTVHGTGYVLDFGLQTVSGTYKVIATNATTFCTQPMTGSTTVAPVPAPSVYSVTGGGNYCAGSTGKNIGLDNSDVNVTYQLWNGTAAVGTAVAGTGSALDLGLQSGTGTYTVKATDATAGCISSMSGTATITSSALPAQYTTSGGGSFCAGGTGSHIYLSGSEAGVSYNVTNGISTGAIVAGTGLGLDLGAQTVGGTYTVVGVNSLTTCAATMLSSATVNVIPAPAVHTVIGGGSFCAGGTGVNVGLDSSESSVKYQLYRGTTAIGYAAWGINDTLPLGVATVAGTYTVKAIDPATGCSSDMSAAAAVIVNPVIIPKVTLSSDAGAGWVVCAGTMVNYTATPSGGGTSPVYEWHAIVGTKDSLIATASDMMSYIPSVTGEKIKVIIRSSEACAVSTGGDSVLMTVRANGTPSVAISSDPGLTVCPGSSVILSAATPLYGGSAPTYKWTKGASATVLSTMGTYSYIPSNGDKINLEMTSNDNCALSPIATTNVTLTVQALSAPVFTIASDVSGPSIASGQRVTLTAVITANGGPSPAYQWIVNSAAVAGATDNTYTSDQFFNNDSVACVVTGSGDCGGVAASAYKIIGVHNVGVANVTANSSDVRIYPNPNKGVFTITGKLGASVTTAGIEITNMLGQSVYSAQASVQGGQLNREVALSNMATGMYILNIRSGNEVSVFHFVIE